MKRLADISECGQYRWWLRRRWGHDERVICFVMLNPSTADVSEDDPTIRRCIAFAQREGFDCLSVRNLFPFRATDPDSLKSASIDIRGGDRGFRELKCALTADVTVAAWGASGPAKLLEQTSAQFLSMVDDHSKLLCFGKTKTGHPKHPLYLPNNAPLVPFFEEVAVARDLGHREDADFKKERGL